MPTWRRSVNVGGPTVDPDALAVLALACRDHEQVRFEYRRRDGDERAGSSSRTNSCRRVGAGTSWRGTFGATTGGRSGSTGSTAARLAGLRCAAACAPRRRCGGVRRRVDPDDALAVLRADSTSMVRADAVRAALRRSDADVDPIDAGRSRVPASAAGATTPCCGSSPCSRVRSRSRCREPAELVERVEQVVARLQRRPVTVSA